MSRVIIFSRIFPSYHPRKGEPTFFVDKIWAAIKPSVEVMAQYYAKADGIHHISDPANKKYPPKPFDPKFTTIRAGNRWKVGDKFSPRVWSGKPYRSKQIIIGPDIEVKKIWEIEIDQFYNVSIPSKNEDLRRKGYRYLIPCGDVAKNDGLSYQDFKGWFPKSFNGQIICWNEKIKY